MQTPNPCPVCGSIKLAVFQSVHCGDCGCVGPQAASVAEAIQKWNQRTLSQAWEQRLGTRNSAPFQTGQLVRRDTGPLVGKG